MKRTLSSHVPGDGWIQPLVDASTNGTQHSLSNRYEQYSQQRAVKKKRQISSECVVFQRSESASSGTHGGEHMPDGNECTPKKMN